MEKLFDVEAEDLSGAYSEMAQIIGINDTYKVYKYFRGQQITFPLKFYTPKCIAGMLIEEFDGSNIHDLSRKYGYSESRIRQLLSKGKSSDE